MKSNCVFTGTEQCRLAHTDLKVPDFSAYRKNQIGAPPADKETDEASRKAFTYLMLAGKSCRFLNINACLIMLMAIGFCFLLSYLSCALSSDDQYVFYI